MFCPDFDVSLWIRKYKITVAMGYVQCCKKLHVFKYSVYA